MSEQKEASRRQFLLGGLGLAGAWLPARAALAEVCGLTPPQTSGPFYPLSKITDNSINDLTLIAGHPRTAKGEVVYLTGRILDEACRPIAGALVEVWLAAASGRYDHPADTSGLERDPDFQNWGEFVTEADGRYAFKSIVPGAYPADQDWWRPPHVHFKVTRRGYAELVTQMYFTPSSFEGEKAREVERLNRLDKILGELKTPESVVVEFTRAAKATHLGPLVAYQGQGAGAKLVPVGELVAETGEKVGNFDLTIRRLR